MSGSVEFIDVTIDELVEHLIGEASPSPQSASKADRASNEAHRAKREPSVAAPQSADQGSLIEIVLVDDLSGIESLALLVIGELST